MLLWIGRHAVVECLTRMFDGRAVIEESLVEPVDLSYQFRGVCMAAEGGGEHLVVACLVASQQQ